MIYYHHGGGVMGNKTEGKNDLLIQLIESQLKPNVKAIDAEAFYAEAFLKSLGEKGFFLSEEEQAFDTYFTEMNIIREVAKVCMTTAFCLWCHFAALIYVRKTPNLQLKEKMLPFLEKGEVLGSTGLSNAMKYYAGIEKLHLQAKPADGGYVLSGRLPAVSNLGKDHWFGVIANVEENKRIMLFVSSSVEGLELKERTEFLGVNGSATHACTFNDVFIPNEWIVTEDADSFINSIRPVIVLYQIPLGLGVTEASIDGIEKVKMSKNGWNQFLKLQPHELTNELNEIEQRVGKLYRQNEINWKEIASMRLDTVYLTLKTVHASMLHHGSSGYVRESDPARQLREAYFLANLTPTLQQLEKVVHPS